MVCQLLKKDTRINYANKYSRRIWSVNNARFLHEFYNRFITLLRFIKPLLPYLPVTLFEKTVKGVLFDCQMCGNCILSSTGMSCPMNCPKGIRNGPCGGVREDGGCEVIHDMPCVWVLAHDGNKKINGDIDKYQPILNHEEKGSSSWLKDI